MLKELIFPWGDWFLGKGFAQALVLGFVCACAKSFPKIKGNKIFDITAKSKGSAQIEMSKNQNKHTTSFSGHISDKVISWQRLKVKTWVQRLCLKV